MKERKLNIGWAQCSITPHQPLLMEGQMYPRVSRYVHDPITATALVLENEETQVIFVSMDMTEVPNHAMAPLKAALELVQKLVGKTKRWSPKIENGEKSMFSDLLYCADCGHKLWHHINTNNHTIHFFSCSNYKTDEREQRPVHPCHSQVHGDADVDRTASPGTDRPY